MRTVAIIIGALTLLLSVGAGDFVVEGLWLNKPPGIIASGVLFGLVGLLLFGGLALAREIWHSQ